MKRLIYIKQLRLYVVFYYTLLLSIYNHHKAEAQSFEIGTWQFCQVKYQPTPKLQFFGEAQLRSIKWFNWFHYYEIKAGLQKQISSKVSIALGVGTYQTYKETGNFKLPQTSSEIRLWPQLTYQSPLYALNIEHRCRIENRFSSTGYAARFRYRLGCTFPIMGKPFTNNSIQLQVANELFFQSKLPHFTRNRFSMMFAYQYSKTISYQLGFVHQTDFKTNDETGRQFGLMGIILNFKTSSTQTKPHVTPTAMVDL